MPTWTTSPLPVRPGFYMNFLAAATAAVTQGVLGTAAIIGVGDWGPNNQVVPISSQGNADNTYWANSGGTVHQGCLDALSGTDQQGAGLVLGLRVTSASASAAQLTLNDGSASGALLLTAKYPGIRPNQWTVNVQTNALNASNKDLYLLESGVIISSYVNIAGGSNAAFATAMAKDPFVNATAIPTQGPGARALANITGVIGGAGGFGGGQDGASPQASDWTGALNLMAQQDFDTVTIVGISDSPTQTLFNSWLVNLNANVRRAFGIIGGPASEGMTAAVQRSQGYNNRDLINIGATDLVNVATQINAAPYQMVARLAGAVAGTGFSRSMTNQTLTGYQVIETTLANSDYANADTYGVFCFTNNTTTQVRTEAGVTTFSQPGPNDPPTAHLQIRNVAIDHFMNNTLQTTAQQTDIGQIFNTSAGQNFVITQILNLCKTLETANALQAGQSTVTLDTANASVGTAMFIDVNYEYQGIAERFFVKTSVQ